MRSGTTGQHFRNAADRPADNGKTGWGTEVYREYAETEDAGFLELAEKSFRRQLRMLPLKKEDIEEFLRFAEKEGYADETMQIKSIELSRQGLEHTADMQQREITQKCRLSVGLGAMSGLLILLLLV